MRIKGRPAVAGGNLLPALAGAAVAWVTVGAVLPLARPNSPLCAPFALFFLVGGPALGIGAALSGLASPARIVLATAGAIAADALVAQVLPALGATSAGAGVAAVTGVTVLFALYAWGRRWRKRNGPRSIENAEKPVN